MLVIKLRICYLEHSNVYDKNRCAKVRQSKQVDKILPIFTIILQNEIRLGQCHRNDITYQKRKTFNRFSGNHCPHPRLLSKHQLATLYVADSRKQIVSRNSTIYQPKLYEIHKCIKANHEYSSSRLK